MRHLHLVHSKSPEICKVVTYFLFTSWMSVGWVARASLETEIMNELHHVKRICEVWFPIVSTISLSNRPRSA